MADAYKCDRCGEYKDGKPECLFEFPNPFRAGLTDSDERKMSLCAKCQDALTEFMGGERRNEKHAVELFTSKSEFIPFGDRVIDLDFSIKLPRCMRRTDLKRQVDMGAKNY